MLRCIKYTYLTKTPRVGLEPTTPRLTAVCSTIELSGIIYLRFISIPSELHTESRLSYILQFFHPSTSKLDCVSLRASTWLRLSSSFASRSLSLSSLPKLSLRPISICQLHTLPYFHPKPIYLVVFKGSY